MTSHVVVRNVPVVSIARDTVARELFVGASGLALVLFIIAHLAGNFFLFGGPEAYNAYAEHLHAVGPLLWMARLGLIAAFMVHVGFTIWLALENRQARDTRYAVKTHAGGTDVAKVTMLYTGILMLTFVVLHILDFAMGDQAGARSVVEGWGEGKSLGLYGLVWNSFANPLHSLFYLAALAAVGLHFSNAVSTIGVTFGALTESAMAKATIVARVMGVLVTLAFASIPLYVLATTYLATAR